MKNILWRLGRQISQLANHLVPTVCLLCGTDLRRELLCPACEFALPHLEKAEHRCQQCALPLASAGDYCGHCLHKPPAFTRLIAPFSYHHPVDYLIHHFKYRRQLVAGRALGQMLADYVRYSYEEQGWVMPDLIIPVPLHWTRRWLRGFNQTELLARQISRQLGVTMESRACRRIQRTPSQQGLNRAKRQKNLRRAFKAGFAVNRLKGCRVALLDDVVTTTATTRELSRLLLDHGAQEVHVWALARTPDTVA